MGKRRKVSALLLILALTACLTAGCSDIVSSVLKENKKTTQEETASGAKKQQNAVEAAAEKEKIQSISVGNYAYECLDETGKAVYDQMLAAILNYQEKVELVTTDSDIMRRSYQALNSDYGGLYWVDGYVFTQYTKGDELVGLEFSPTYTMEHERQKEIQQQIDAVVDQWLGGISITDSDYAKAKYVFETLVQQVDYVEDASDNQNIISVFINRQTVCQGYASATQYLLKQLGIPCTIVTGMANGQSHAWNLVLLNGNYYHMDTTWGNSTYLDADSREAKFVNYNYLCLTTEEIMKSHSPSNDFTLPECTAVAESYYVQEGRYFDTWQPELAGEVFANAWTGKEPSISVKFSTDELYRQACDYFIGEQKIAEYCEGMEYVYYLKDDSLRVLTINFN